MDTSPRSSPGQPTSWPPADPEIEAALRGAFADGSWGRYHGPHGRRLADALAEMHDVEFVSLCCSGTFAVELALRAVQVGAGDEVILAGYDYPGNFRAIEAVGARPVLVDVDRRNWNLDPACLNEAIGSRTRAVIASHLHAGVVPIREVRDFTQEHGLTLIEDACQATGATIEGRPAGSWGDVGVLSFGGSKLLTAGRGGALLTRSGEIHQRAKIVCEHGNHAFPLSELQAAVLVPQLARLAERNRQRMAAAERFLKGLASAPGLRPLLNRVAALPAFYKLGMRFVPEELSGCSRAEFLTLIQSDGISLDAGFRGFGLRGPRRCRAAGELIESRSAAERCVVLHHPLLLEPVDVVERAAETIARVARACAAAGARF